MNLLIALFLIISEAVYEGLHDRGIKTIAGIIEDIHRLFCVVIIFAWATNYWQPTGYGLNFWYVFPGYILMRFAIFNPINNFARGNNLFFVGTTKWPDRVENWLINKGKVDPRLLFFVRCIAFVWGFFWLMGWENGIRI